MNKLNPSRRFQFSLKTKKLIKQLSRIAKLSKEVEEGTICDLIEGRYVEYDHSTVKDLLNKVAYPERVWCIANKEIKVFVFDCGNSWIQILQINDRENNILWEGKW